jgi:hypothetical protein
MNISQTKRHLTFLIHLTHVFISKKKIYIYIYINSLYDKSINSKLGVFCVIKIKYFNQ